MKIARYVFTCLFAGTLFWGIYAFAEVQRIYVLKEIDDDNIIIVTRTGEQLLLKKWSLRFSPLLFEGKYFTADISPSWVTIYFENRDPIKWSIESSLGNISPRGSPKKPPSTPGAGLYAGVGGGHWIQQVLGNGKYIALEDGSLWEVSPIDVIYSAIWLPVSNIAVVEGNGPYPYKLINTDDGEKVDATYLGQK